METEPRGKAVLVRLVCVWAALVVSACAARGPVVGGNAPPVISGTISGIVRSVGAGPLADRRVTAVEADSGAKYETTTATNGGYTLKVPMGHYRLDVELRAGEAVVERPGPLTISRSDLDSQRNFVIGAQKEFEEQLEPELLLPIEDDGHLDITLR
jgi:hypothetical protein